MTFRREFLVLKDGRPLRDALEPWQVEHILNPLDARTDAGEPAFRLLYIELPRGHAKTTLAGAEALTELAVGGPFRRVSAYATDEGQARYLHDAAAGFIRRSSVLSEVFVIERDRIRIPERDSSLEIMSADDASAYGRTDDLTIFDEVGKLRKRELWFAAYTAIAKQPHARILCISSPGWSRSMVAWAIREAARTTPGYYLFSPGKRLATWLDDAEFERQRTSSTQPEFVFRREQLGQWTDGDGAFITRADLARCPRLPAYRTACSEQSTHVLAIDLGLKRDRTAAAILHRDRARDLVALDDLRVWEGSRDDPVLIAEVESHIRRAIDDYAGLRVVVDPWNLVSTVQRFRGRIKEFHFTAESKRRLAKNLYSLLHNGHFGYPPDADLERELLDVQLVERASGLVIDHDSSGHDDMVVSIGMAALELMSEPPPSYASASVEPDPYFVLPQARTWRDIGAERARGVLGALRR